MKWKNVIRGWLPKDSSFPLANNQRIRLAITNRRVIDKTLVAGTVTVTIIILLFGLFFYSMFSTPLGDSRGQFNSFYSVDESLRLYLNITNHGGEGFGGIYNGWTAQNGTVNWIGKPQDSIKSLENIHLVMYTRVYNETSVPNAKTSGSNVTIYYIGTLWQHFPMNPHFQTI